MLLGMGRNTGFTIVELLVTLTIMVILITLATVNLMDSLTGGRDVERESDVQNIISFQEGLYERNSASYFPTSAVAAGADAWYPNIDKNNLRAPGVVSPANSLVAATNTVQTTSGVLPQPTTTTYVYQPLTKDGLICGPALMGYCRKFNIYFLRESDGVVVMLSSKNQ